MQATHFSISRIHKTSKSFQQVAFVNTSGTQNRSHHLEIYSEFFKNCMFMQVCNMGGCVNRTD